MVRGTTLYPTWYTHNIKLKHCTYKHITHKKFICFGFFFFYVKMYLVFHPLCSLEYNSAECTLWCEICHLSGSLQWDDESHWKKWVCVTRCFRMRRFVSSWNKGCLTLQNRVRELGLHQESQNCRLKLTRILILQGVAESSLCMTRWNISS